MVRCVWVFPCIQGKVFLKMHWCHHNIVVTPCYVNSVKCSYVSLSSPDKADTVSCISLSVPPRLCLHLVPIGCIDRIWALVTSTSAHKTSEWDSSCHYRGSQIPPACAYLILRRLGGIILTHCITHCCTPPPCLAVLWSFIVTALHHLCQHLVLTAVKKNLLL